MKTNRYVIRACKVLAIGLLGACATGWTATTVNLTAQRAIASMPNGVSVPMWQFCGTAAIKNADGTPSIGTTSKSGSLCTGPWSQGPTITVPAGEDLTVNLTNSLKVPTSLVVLGQFGGGLGAGTSMTSPDHSTQSYSTFPSNAGPVTIPFVAPVQQNRVKSFGSEAPAATATASGRVTLTWKNLKPGTYLYETGTLPSLQAPMGLYGMLIVTMSPRRVEGEPSLIAGDAYPLLNSSVPVVPYDSEAALLFSEVDAFQNTQIDRAERAGTDMAANLRFNDPRCSTNCYPAAVNYTPTYFLINGQPFDRFSTDSRGLPVGDRYRTGNILVRFANAGLRTHIPSVVGLPMALVGEDGNLAPGKPRVQNEVLLTAGKTYDTIVSPKATPGVYSPATHAIFDRQGSLSTDNRVDGGMQAFLLVNGDGVNPGQPGGVPAEARARAVNDAFSTPINTRLSADVKANDIGVATVQIESPVRHGTLSLAQNGTFTYDPTPGFVGLDTFTYSGNGGNTNVATVSIKIGSSGQPIARDDNYISNIATIFRMASPGVLANDSDPDKYPLEVDAASVANGTSGPACGTVSVKADGSFMVTAGKAPTCVFSYKVKNSQGVLSNAATVKVAFATGSGVALNVIDAKSGTPIADYRWLLQEDLTFNPTTYKTPLLNTRTLGTSFHRSYNPVVAAGCVGAVSCGSSQKLRGVDVVVGPETKLADVAIDPKKRYYVSVLPGDAQNPTINGGGAPVQAIDALGNKLFDSPGVPTMRKFDMVKDCGLIGDPTDPCGHSMGGTGVSALGATNFPAGVTVGVQRTPLVPAQLSIFIYEDNKPANGQYDTGEKGLGGFNIILIDPAGRPGDPAGQQTYDAFNMPITNALFGKPGCPDLGNAGATAAAGNSIVGAVYTCPNAPEGYNGDPAAFALAGHALIQNITPARYDVVAHPSAARRGAGEVWWQTETLEGTAAQDAFAGINEPRYFQEFGPPGLHTTIGFVSPGRVKKVATDTKQLGGLTGINTISGKVTNQHLSRPSNTRLWDSDSYKLLEATNCRVVLNAGGGNGDTIATAECTPEGEFKFAGVLSGSYEVAIFDQWLDQIIQRVAVVVPAQVNPAVIALGNIPVLSWFSQIDLNQKLDDGAGKLSGLSNQALVVRYRNGSIGMTAITDATGNAIIPELFPLFNWYVTESDMTRYKQKAVNIAVDGGGQVDTTGQFANLISTKYADGKLTTRTESPGATSYGLQGFISQRSRVEWIKTPYAKGENGGIQGKVVLSTTRAYDDPRLGVQTIWEPLVPRVKVNLYRVDHNLDGTVSMLAVDSTITSSWDDWVNSVYGADGKSYVLGPDQLMRDELGNIAPLTAYPAGKQVNMSCPGQLPGPAKGQKPPFDMTKVDPFTTYSLNDDSTRCYDGFHAWNQVQAAPYDGRYQFPSAAYIEKHKKDARPAGHTLVSMPAGEYVVELEIPTGFSQVKEEDKNILIGDAFIAPVVQQFGGLGSVFILPDQATLNNANPFNTLVGAVVDPVTGNLVGGVRSNPTNNLGVTNIKANVPSCVGDMHRVPDYLSIFPQAKLVAPFAGADRPLCDKKLVKLGEQMQANASFFVFTDTPLASNATGIILDDASAEFNAASPDFGEKASVPYVPVSTKDFAGREISRVISDQWGAYNLMLPSSWLVNPPTPSGYGPHMLVNCINDPGPIPDPTGAVDPVTGKVRMITDPAYNPAYSNFCYTNPFMPGQTTYLDTPVLPIAAFAGGYNPADCDYSEATPAIARVDGPLGVGPYLPPAGGQLAIRSLGDKAVKNTAYAGPFAVTGLGSEQNVTRHYGFGATSGQVRLIDIKTFPASSTVPASVSLAVTSWKDTDIVVQMPSLPNGVTSLSGQLLIIANNGKSSVDAVTLTQEAVPPTYVYGSKGDTIQSAIDKATPGDLIIVDAGTYNELVVMWKPVRLQGVGASSVIINAAKFPTSKLEQWRPTINALFGIDARTGNPAAVSQVDALPGQEVTGGIVLLEPSVLGSEEGAGITVLAKGFRADGVTPLGSGAVDCLYGGGTTITLNLDDGALTVPKPNLSNFKCARSRIDGLSVTGGDSGGGIYVNGWAHNLEIANNRVYGNAGAFNGGVRIGVPYLETFGYPGQNESSNGGVEGERSAAGFGYDNGIRIHHNSITKNGTVEGPTGGGGAGGGISICTGTDGYSVDNNWVCGNYSTADGGGIGHIGFSQGGQIVNNKILFNQSFQQTIATHGGGIFVGGEPSSGSQIRTLGTGNLTIDSNVIRGNFAEAGHGGGIRLQNVNGADVELQPDSPAQWNKVVVTNNIIDNNVAGWSGGGISLSDTLISEINSNTIASNDSVGIAGPVVNGATVNQTIQVGTGKPAPAGISSEPNSALLTAVIPNNPAILTASQKVVSSPKMANNVIWKNRSFFAKSVNGNESLCASNNMADRAGVGCLILPEQTLTGQCTGLPAYWDIGLLTDSSAVPSLVRLNPTGSILTVAAGYGPSNSTNDPGFGIGALYCNGSRVTPELGEILNPPSPFKMQVAATVDEANNYISMRYGPLHTLVPGTKKAVGNYSLTGSIGAAIADVAP